MKLTEAQINQAFKEVKLEHRELANTIIRLGGDKEDYRKVYDKLRGFTK